MQDCKSLESGQSVFVSLSQPDDLTGDYSIPTLAARTFSYMKIVVYLQRKASPGSAQQAPQTTLRYQIG
jgi:hypothetical protein